MIKAKPRTAATHVKTRVSLDDMILSHERALFGYTDRDSLTIIPGLLERIADANGDITDMKKDMSSVKKTISDVPEIVELGRSIKRWGTWGAAAIIALLVSVVMHQYGLVAIIMRAILGPS